LATTVILLCAATTRSSRIGGFAGRDEPLDEPGRAAAAAFMLDPRFRARVHASPALSAMQTAAALEVEGSATPALADIDHGRWAGRSFAQVHDDAPDAFARWLADPTAATPGGEAMDDVARRVGAWLDAVAAEDGPVLAITHATVIRAALAQALFLPLRSTLAIDIAPLARVELSFNRIWRLQALGS